MFSSAGVLTIIATLRRRCGEVLPHKQCCKSATYSLISSYFHHAKVKPWTASFLKWLEKVCLEKIKFYTLWASWTPHLSKSSYTLFRFVNWQHSAADSPLRPRNLWNFTIRPHFPSQIHKNGHKVTNQFNPHQLTWQQDFDLNSNTRFSFIRGAGVRGGQLKLASKRWERQPSNY